MRMAKQGWGILLLAVLLTACAKAPDMVVQNGVAAQPETKAPAPIPEETAAATSQPGSLDARNAEIIADAQGCYYDLTIESSQGKRLVINAPVDVSNVERVDCYEYERAPITDAQRENLFAAYFDDRAGEVVHNTYMGNEFWELRNWSSAGDDYRYEEDYSGESGPWERVFTLENQAVDLYPYEDNLLDSVNEVQPNLEKALSQCDALIAAITDRGKYMLDDIRPLGSDGRGQYYWILFTQRADGMPITAYRDLKFYVNGEGVEHFSGALFDIGESILDSQILSVGEAVDILCNNAQLINAGDLDLEAFFEGSIPISKITLEYIVDIDLYGTAKIFPCWRFQIGADEAERNLLRSRVLAVNAITGELIAEERS